MKDFSACIGIKYTSSSSCAVPNPWKGAIMEWNEMLYLITPGNVVKRYRYRYAYIDIAICLSIFYLSIYLPLKVTINTR